MKNPIIQFILFALIGFGIGYLVFAVIGSDEETATNDTEVVESNVDQEAEETEKTKEPAETSTAAETMLETLESMQLIDLSGDKMEVIQSAPVNPEPHYAQIIKADKINTITVYDKDESNPYAVYNQEDTRIERNGNEVHIYGIAMRSKFIFDANSERPDVIEVNEGDKVYLHLTNIDFDQDITHGLGINKYDLNIEVQPEQTNTIEFVADKAGTFPIYCTNFCSALHQEMTGYLLVKPKN